MMKALASSLLALGLLAGAVADANAAVVCRAGYYMHAGACVRVPPARGATTVCRTGYYMHGGACVRRVY